MTNPMRNAMANGLGLGLPTTNLGLPVSQGQLGMPYGGGSGGQGGLGGQMTAQPYQPYMPGGGGQMLDPYDPMKPEPPTLPPLGQRPMIKPYGGGGGVRNRLANPY